MTGHSAKKNLTTLPRIRTPISFQLLVCSTLSDTTSWDEYYLRLYKLKTGPSSFGGRKNFTGQTVIWASYISQRRIMKSFTTIELQQKWRMPFCLPTHLASYWYWALYSWCTGAGGTLCEFPWFCDNRQFHVIYCVSSRVCTYFEEFLIHDSRGFMILKNNWPNLLGLCHFPLNTYSAGMHVQHTKNRLTEGWTDGQTKDQIRLTKAGWKTSKNDQWPSRSSAWMILHTIDCWVRNLQFL